MSEREIAAALASLEEACRWAARRLGSPGVAREGFAALDVVRALLSARATPTEREK